MSDMDFVNQVVLAMEATTEETQRVVQSAWLLAKQSLTEGLALTGAPGQPERTGDLKKSFQERLVSPVEYELATNSEYAIPIEDGGTDRVFFDPARGDPRSNVGGYHSLKLTESSWDLIVAEAAKTDAALVAADG